MYAHVSYLWDGEGPCLILLSSAKESFPSLSKGNYGLLIAYNLQLSDIFNNLSVKARVEEEITSYKRYNQLREEISSPQLFASQQVNLFTLTLNDIPGLIDLFGSTLALYVQECIVKPGKIIFMC